MFNSQALPSLDSYRDSFIDAGVAFPLKQVSSYAHGLLQKIAHVTTAKTGWPWTSETDPNLYRGKIWPKISIVIPSYNQGEYTEEAIRSVILQNYPNLELIVMDGGSTDETKDILEKYQPWISYWQSKPDKGQGHAINLGFSLASGDYLGWLNSDDYYNQSALYHLGLEIQKSDKDFYYGDAKILMPDDKLLYWQANYVAERYLHFGGLIASHSTFWKKEIHQPIWEKMNCNVDGELWIRMVPKASTKHIRFPIGTLRIQPESKTANERWKAKWEEDDVNIHAVHGLPPKIRGWLFYEYRYFQRLYKFLYGKRG